MSRSTPVQIMGYAITRQGTASVSADGVVAMAMEAWDHSETAVIDWLCAATLRFIRKLSIVN